MIIKRLQTERQVQVAWKPGCEPGVNRDDQSQNCQESNNQLKFGIFPHVSPMGMRRIPPFHILKSRVAGNKRSHTRERFLVAGYRALCSFRSPHHNGCTLKQASRFYQRNSVVTPYCGEAVNRIPLTKI